MSPPPRVPAAALVALALALALALAGCGSARKPAAPTAGHHHLGGVAPVPPAGGVTSDGRVTVSASGHLPAPVQLPAVAPSGRGVVAIGGLDSRDASVADVVRVDGRRATVAGRIPAVRHDAAAATLGGATFLFGGGEGGAGISEILRIEPGGTARPVGRLPMPASDVGAATVGGTAYVVGGYSGTTPLRSIVAYAPGRAARTVGSLPRPLRYAAVAAVGGQVLIAGGTAGTTARREVLSFDPRTGAVRAIGRLPHPVTHAAGAALGGRFYVLGGRGGVQGTQRAEILSVEPVSGRVRAAGRLPSALSDLGAASLPGRIVALGGRDATGGVRDGIWTVRAAPAGGTAGPVGDPARDVYAAGRPGRLSAEARRAVARVYVPNSASNTVDVISQRTFRVVDHFAVPTEPQHVTPSWDLKTLWVTSDRGNALVPIDPRTGRHGRPVTVTDPYNLYFTVDGRRAIVVAEAHRQLDFRSPRTMRLRHSLPVPQCAGVDHMDYTASGHYALVSCEFAGRMIVVDLRRERVTGTIGLRAGAMPQDVKLSPDGRTFYVADMASGGVWLIDALRMRKLGFEATGAGAHGLYPSRDSRTLYVSNRGEGSITLISFRTRRPVAKWRLPGGGSPDMGGLSADGKILWLSGRYNGEVYAISTATGHLLRRIRVGSGPHGMAVWPQPGRYSIGHTGILR
jgi:DNA-binding beta-propeller fold protein YncE